MKSYEISDENVSNEQILIQNIAGVVRDYADGMYFDGDEAMEEIAHLLSMNGVVAEDE